jgi:hypothetical protein
VVDTETGEEARLLYPSATKSTLCGMIFVFDSKARSRERKPEFGSFYAIHSHEVSFTSRERQGANRRVAVAGVAMVVHSVDDVDHPATSAPSETATQPTPYPKQRDDTRCVDMRVSPPPLNQRYVADLQPRRQSTPPGSRGSSSSTRPRRNHRRSWSRRSSHLSPLGPKRYAISLTPQSSTLF